MYLNKNHKKKNSGHKRESGMAPALLFLLRLQFNYRVSTGSPSIARGSVALAGRRPHKRHTTLITMAYSALAPNTPSTSFFRQYNGEALAQKALAQADVSAPWPTFALLKRSMGYRL